jgi:hypothetical protein
VARIGCGVFLASPALAVELDGPWRASGSYVDLAVAYVRAGRVEVRTDDDGRFGTLRDLVVHSTSGRLEPGDPVRFGGETLLPWQDDHAHVERIP